MRLHVLSDLHLEFHAFRAPSTDADVVILAGDISTGANGLRWAQEVFPDRPVIYVLGNHEFYGHKVQKLIAELREEAAGTHVHVLENASVQIGGVTFLGATLWTDLALDGDPIQAGALAEKGMLDYRRIRTLPLYRRLRAADTRQYHQESRRWLEEQLLALKGSRVVVVTHHAPCPKSIPPKFTGDPLNPAFASEMTQLVTESEARLWVHGHIHSWTDYLLGSTRVLANPRGYPTESRDSFDPKLVVEV